MKMTYVGVSYLSEAIELKAFMLFVLTACPAGTYLSPSNGSCSDCPANSVSEEEGLAQCTCVEGYYRAPRGEEDLPCART